MTKPARFSFAVLAATLVLAGFLHLGGPLLALLFSYFALTKLGEFIRNKWLAFAVFLLVVAGLAYASVHFTRAAITALPKIAENSIPAATAWAQAREIELPFTDFESLKNVAMDALKEQVHYLRNFANFARNATTLIVFVIIGVVAAVSLFFNSQLDIYPESHAVRHNLYSICCDEISARFREFYQSFATVMGAQMTISCINTVLTSIFVLAAGLPYAPFIIGITFLCGLVPIVGNVISNTIIVFVGFLVSPKVAIGALVFLVVIHKLEYFLNSKIIGDRIRNPIWLTFFGLIVGEKLMGIPGLILAPVVLNYLRVELSKVEVDPPVAASEHMTIDPVDRPS
jgi:predicted PurR-regulated permease PerM